MKGKRFITRNKNIPSCSSLPKQVAWPLSCSGHATRNWPSEPGGAAELNRGEKKKEGTWVPGQKYLYMDRSSHTWLLLFRKANQSLPLKHTLFLKSLLVPLYHVCCSCKEEYLGGEWEGRAITNKQPGFPWVWSAGSDDQNNLSLWLTANNSVPWV